MLCASKNISEKIKCRHFPVFGPETHIHFRQIASAHVTESSMFIQFTNFDVWLTINLTFNHPECDQFGENLFVYIIFKTLNYIAVLPSSFTN